MNHKLQSVQIVYIVFIVNKRWPQRIFAFVIYSLTLSGKWVVDS